MAILSVRQWTVAQGLLLGGVLLSGGLQLGALALAPSAIFFGNAALTFTLAAFMLHHSLTANTGHRLLYPIIAGTASVATFLFSLLSGSSGNMELATLLQLLSLTGLSLLAVALWQFLRHHPAVLFQKFTPAMGFLCAGAALSLVGLLVAADTGIAALHALVGITLAVVTYLSIHFSLRHLRLHFAQDPQLALTQQLSTQLSELCHARHLQFSHLQRSVVKGRQQVEFRLTCAPGTEVAKADAQAAEIESALTRLPGVRVNVLVFVQIPALPTPVKV